MWVADVDPREKGWVPLGNRSWRLPNGSYYTFPADQPEKLRRRIDEGHHIPRALHAEAHQY